MQPKAKLSNNSIPMKKGLKLEGGSMNDRDTHMPSINYDAEVMSSVHKKKSHTNLQTMKLDEHPDKPKHKKLQKIMSEEKNLKLNFDVNVKINLKINQRSVEKRELREQIESKIENKLKGVTKNRLLP